MDPALTRQTIGELIDSWTAQLSDSVEHVKQCETAGIVSVNLCSGVNMTAEAMRQQGTKVRQHIDCELDPTARAIANLHHNTDTSSLPQDIKLIRKHHIDLVFKKYDTVDLVVISTPCQDLSCANSAGKGLEGTESVLIMQALDVLDMIKELNPKVKYLIENVRFKEKHPNAYEYFCQ
jgi:site-specific DNA-cytosine methylase